MDWPTIAFAVATTCFAGVAIILCLVADQHSRAIRHLDRDIRNLYARLHAIEREQATTTGYAPSETVTTTEQDCN
ncbi:hypothetical protein QDX23_03415 [Auritidibacter ignavus]|uniref:hypothetical protein n=1 Tax=Auritidibacter ignavus TaxID=678932 RepID=UPI002448532E|nr:hypothetical protein [Auritidibacter ignavus]WGH91428.1 hypothetical protein QDX23_03415 [Auritidibacter ignavus]